MLSLEYLLEKSDNQLWCQTLITGAIKKYTTTQSAHYRIFYRDREREEGYLNESKSFWVDCSQHFPQGPWSYLGLEKIVQQDPFVYLVLNKTTNLYFALPTDHIIKS